MVKQTTQQALFILQSPWLHIKPNKYMCVLLLFFLEVSPSLSKPCEFPVGKTWNGMAASGDIIIGGLFPVHFGIGGEKESLREAPRFPGCIDFNPRVLRWTMSMVYAIAEINRNHNLLPNVTLGYVIHDSCFRVPTTVQSTLYYMEPLTESEEPCFYQAVIGTSGSTLAVAMARLLGIFYIPQISYASACKCLADKKQYPSFMRTFPNDSYHSSALVSLVRYFGWLYIGTLAVDDAYGRNGVTDFLQEAEMHGVCIAFHHMLPKVQDERILKHLGELVDKPKPKVILLYSTEPDFVPFAEEVLRQNITGKTWIASQTWVTSPLIDTSKFAPVFEGTIGFSVRKGTIKGLQDYLTSLKPKIKHISNRQKRHAQNRFLITSCNEKGFCLQSKIEMVLLNNYTFIKFAEYQCVNISGFAFDKHNVSFQCKNYRNVANFEVCRDFATKYISQPKALKEQNNTLCNESMLAVRSSKKKAHFSTESLHDSIKTSFDAGKVAKASDDITEDRFLNDFILELWENTFHCIWDERKVGNSLCTGEERLSEVYSPFTDTTQLRVTFNTFMGVYAIAHALQDIRECVHGKGPFVNSSCCNINDFEHWQLLFYLKKVQFKNNMGEEIHFDKNGDPPTVFELINWYINSLGLVEFKVVGGFDSNAKLGEELQVDRESIMWSGRKTNVPQSVCSEPCLPGTRKIARKGEAFCCFDCLLCTAGKFSNSTDSQDCSFCPKYYWSNENFDGCLPMPEEFLAFLDPLAIILLSIALLGIVIIMMIGLIIFHYRDLPTVNATNIQTEMVLLGSLMTYFCCCFVFVGKPWSWTCKAREAAVCFLFTVCITCLLSIAVQMLKNSTDKALLQGNFTHYFKNVNLKAVVIICILPQLVHCIIWVLLGSSRAVQNTDIHPGTTVFECAGESPAWSASSVSYIGFLVFVCLNLGLKARKLSSSPKESKFITFSMLSCFLVCLAFLPANNSTQGKYQVATKIFGIIATAFGLLGCIYVPKCYIYVFKLKNTSAKL